MAILNGWWVDDRTPDAVRTLEIEGWLDVLQDLSEAEVRDAWGSYQRNGARTASGRLVKPDAGALWHVAMDARAVTARTFAAAERLSREEAEYRAERERLRENPVQGRAEAVARIMAEVGYTLSAKRPPQGE